MIAISQTRFSDAFSWIKNYILIEISLKCVPKGQIDYSPALVLIMAWRQTIISTNLDPIQWRIYAALGRRGVKTLTDITNVILQISFMILKFVLERMETTWGIMKFATNSLSQWLLLRSVSSVLKCCLVTGLISIKQAVLGKGISCLERSASFSVSTASHIISHRYTEFIEHPVKINYR